MNTKFKRKQPVRILVPPSSDLVEFNEAEDVSPVQITKGMLGRINIILPDGKYHVEILDKKGNVIAYAPFDEEDLEAM